MKNIIMLSLILVTLFFVGCSSGETDITDSPSTPEQQQTTNEDLGKPQDLQVYLGSSTVRGILDKWCWEKPDKSCELISDPPEEIIKEVTGYQPIRVKKGESFNLQWGSSINSPIDLRIENPDVLEVKQIKGDQVEILEVNDNKISAPNEEGRYYYSLTLKWTEEIKGEANYAFSVIVE